MLKSSGCCSIVWFGMTDESSHAGTDGSGSAVSMAEADGIRLNSSSPHMNPLVHLGCFHLSLNTSFSVGCLVHFAILQLVPA